MQHLAHDATARSIQIWTLSAFIHELAFGAASMALSDLLKPAQRKPFTWTISLEEPPPRPIPAPEADAPSTQQIAQAAQASPQITETPRTQRARKIVRQEPTEATSFVQKAGHIIQQTPQVVSPASSPISTNRQEVSVETHTIDDLTGPPSANHSAPPSTLQAPISAQAEAGDRSSLPPAQPAAQTADSGVSSAQESPRPIHDAPVTTVVMNHPPIGRRLSLHPDYGWLTDSLRRRVESLKAYPRLARAQGWEGRVVVRATIKDDGNLLDAVVTESSGYASLDEDAVKLMHRVCPVHLTQDLGKSTIAVMIPIRYRLDGFE